LKTLGYPEIIAYLQGRCALEEAVARIQQQTRNYAKRQITWFRRESGLHWLPADAPDLAQRASLLIKEGLGHYTR